MAPPSRTVIRTCATAELDPAAVRALRTLMAAAFDDGFTDDDWDHALGGRHVLLLEDGEVVAHASVVPRRLRAGERWLDAGYVEAVAVDPARQGAGAGTAVMRRIGEVVRAEHDLGALSTSAHGFYARLGWERWRGPTWVLTGDGADPLRTADEDDGIMVLRHGPSASLDVTLALACEERCGDSW